MIDLVHSSREGRGLRSRRVLLLVGIIVGGLVGVRLQPRLARLPEPVRRVAAASANAVPAGDVL